MYYFRAHRLRVAGVADQQRRPAPDISIGPPALTFPISRRDISIVHYGGVTRWGPASRFAHSNGSAERARDCQLIRFPC